MEIWELYGMHNIESQITYTPNTEFISYILGMLPYTRICKGKYESILFLQYFTPSFFFGVGWGAGVPIFLAFSYLFMLIVWAS